MVQNYADSNKRLEKQNGEPLRGQYVLAPELAEAVQVAEVTGRPLLIKGEPGTGKTLLAEHVAGYRGQQLYSWHVKSSSKAQDGLYFYDALSRLNDSRFIDDQNRDRIKNVDNYIRMGAMGAAFQSTQPAVLLIDEIDKADIEFPNDLLLELDQMRFTIFETGAQVIAKHRPLTIITSNNEKELPDAFLRRCIFHYIDFPAKPLMEKIVKSHYPQIEEDFLQMALKVFYQLRVQEDLRKKPSTSELIDWLSILMHQRVKTEISPNKIPFLGALLKNEEDIFRYKK